MSFRTSGPKPKPTPPPPLASAVAPATLTPKDDRKKATVRFTKRQWAQLRAYLYDKDTTLQSLIVSSLAEKLETFDA